MVLRFSQVRPVRLAPRLPRPGGRGPMGVNAVAAAEAAAVRRWPPMGAQTHLPPESENCLIDYRRVSS